jgi:DNA modification methylase
MDHAIYEETGVVHCADNLETLRRLPDEHIDLVYLDPPFFSNRRYEVIWGDEAEVRSFEDRWKGGLREYVDWMRKRMVELHRVLTPTGSLYLHCDPNASHHLKVMLDEVFLSPGGFRSEIVWKRSSAHSDTKQGRRQHGRIHDVILFYTRGADWTWNPVYTPYDLEYVDAFYKHVEPGTGRRYWLGDLTGPGGASKGNPHYEVMGVTRYWRYSRERMQELIDEGRVVQVKPGSVPRYKRYLDEMPGVPLQDVWTDIRPLASRGKERLGYPTQKPEVLMERILASSTAPGQIVLDPFCGCGTTIAVAQQMQRRWIGIDISPMAAAIVKRRVDSFGANATVTGLPATIEDLRALGHFEFQNWVVDEVNGVRRHRKTGDLGIDGYSYMHRYPIEVKQQEKVDRPVVDKFETAMQRDGKDVGYIVAFSFTPGAYDEAARSRQVGKTNVHLVKVADLLDLKDLILAAKAERKEPDVSHITPDLMGFFAGALAERRLSYARPRTSLTELAASAAKARRRKTLPLSPPPGNVSPKTK